jgi:orotidine-5'-phosphate decarboxylase
MGVKFSTSPIVKLFMESKWTHYHHTVEQLALHRAKKALEAKCDGVIASGHEAQMIKELTGNKLLVITPGIRPDGSPEDDPKRVMTPGQAVKAGADYLVLGRPITEPQKFGFATSRQAAQMILADMQSAFDDKVAGH